MESRFISACVLCASVSLWITSSAFAEPLSPRDELATFKTLPGFKVELVASEPDVIDPVAMCFDEHGRMFVCEMIGYPNGGVATGQENRGRIRCLTDRDGDGKFETSTIFADKLRFPTGVLPWKNGLIVCNAPDLIYLKDTDGDGKADRTRVLYTGFGLNNIQQILNSPRWGIDNWVYCTVGSTGGTITCPESPGMKPLVLRGRGIRFHPDRPGDIEPTSGGGQYGLTCDEAGHCFVNTNSQHLRQIVLPDEYLRRNPYLAVSATTVDISEHGAACRVFRISPFEPWRVERTTRRKDSPEAKRFPSTELVPGGYITSACSPCYYGVNEPLFPEKDRGCVYVCDPANNLITRDKLEPNGSIYKGKRIDDRVEFLASTDNWYRPVHLMVGPEGALYVCDFYREVIETPLSLPDDIKKRLNLESRQRGRIWRIVPEGFQAGAAPLHDRENTAGLISHLTGNHQWARETAQRLLYEGNKATFEMKLLEHLIDAVVDGRAAGPALATLERAGGPLSGVIGLGLRSEAAVGRLLALRHADPLLHRDPEMENAVLNMENDPSPLVRFQLALSAGSMNPNLAGPLLARLLRRPDTDRWLVLACLTSAKDAAPGLLAELAMDETFAAGHAAILAQLAGMIGAKGKDDEMLAVVALLGKVKVPGVQLAILQGLGDGMRHRDASLGEWLAKSMDARNRVGPFFRQAAATAGNETAPLPARLAAVRLLGFAPFNLAGEPLAGLLNPRSSGELQSAALRALAGFNDPKVGPLLLAGWEGYGPTLRREATEALVARPDRVTALLDAVEAKTVPAGHIEVARADGLRKHPDPVIRSRANKLLAGQAAGDRKKVIDDYRPALALKADAARGRALFRKNCTACHRLENTGYEVGANLTAALRNKSKAALLVDILDPSREVDPRYVNYQAMTTSGRSVSGLLAVETPTSITLRRGEKAEDTLLRTQIEELRATSKSLMPEEFEKQLNRQQLADLIEYLMDVVR